MEIPTQHTQSNITRIVFYGPESTGKTTLAQTLAEQYNTCWVPEFARDYLQDKYDKTGKICEPKDIMTIAKGQIDLENKMTEKSNNFVFCDTNLLETYVYARIYFPDEDFSELKTIALNHKYDYYFLTNIDTPWIADGLRDKPDEREEMFEAFKAYLIKYQKKFYILKGDLKTRLKTVNSILQNQSL